MGRVILFYKPLLYCSVALIMGWWVNQSPYLRNWRICVVLIGLCVLRGVNSGYNLVLTNEVEQLNITVATRETHGNPWGQE